MRNQEERVENVVDARRIIGEVLNTVGMKAPTFAKEIGINYQRIFDLQRGRTKKFNPGVANLICERFPQINKSYLFTGEGELLVSDKEPAKEEKSQSDIAEVIDMSKKLLDLFQQIAHKDRDLQEKLHSLQDKERELLEKEIDLVKREAQIEQKEIALGIKKLS